MGHLLGWGGFRKDTKKKAENGQDKKLKYEGMSLGLCLNVLLCNPMSPRHETDITHEYCEAGINLEK